MPRTSFAGIVRTIRMRRVDRVAIGYVVAGWLAVQAASILIPTFDAPPWTMRAVIIFAILGFPLVLAVAWFLHPKPFRRARGLSLRPFHWALGMLALLAVLMAGDFALQLTSEGPRPAAPTASAPPAPAANSIAVLPFANMSGDPKKEYLSDGISEDLLNDLANIPSLLVVARTSSFAFKGKNEDIRKIARVLGVRTILEGGVRASGNHLRITAHLVDAERGYDIWTQTYDRDLTDALQVQDDIARAIAVALTHKLLPDAKWAVAHSPAHAVPEEAYQDYLLGKEALAPRTPAGAATALDLFAAATKRAPDFAGAFAALARAEINVAEDHPERADLIPAAHQALARAFTLDPRNIDALSSHLDLSLHEFDWKAALEDARKMRAINPHSAQVLHEMFRFYQFTGFPELALDAARDAAKLDPLSIVDKLNVAAALEHNGQFGEAAKVANAALVLSPGQAYLEQILCTSAARSGDWSAARRAETTLVAAHNQAGADGCALQTKIAQGRLREARELTAKLAASFSHDGPTASEIAEDYAECGDFQSAGDWLGRAYDAKEFLIVLFAYESVVPRDFFATPQWNALMSRPLFVTWRDAHDDVASDLTRR
jgi:TolB-like protein/tetratricopeptide (TPR) repeat protein